MKEKELNVIKLAIINEIEGYEFYKMAAAESGNKASEEALMELANEELKHAEYLKELFDKIKNEEGDNFSLAFLPNPPSPKIFNWDHVVMKSSSLTVSVFGIAMDMEKASVAFYTAARENTSYEEARKLYDLLITWEKVHLDQFEERYREHKEEWWSEQGFSPM